MRVLVVGAGGFIGRHLIRHLGDLPGLRFDIIGMDVAGGVTEGASVISGNAADPDTARAAIHEVNPDCVVNLAGRWGSTTTRDMIQPNVLVTDALLGAIRDCGTRARVIVLGSAAEYGLPSSLPVKETDTASPISPYGVTKLMQTILCDFYRARYDIDIVVARLFNVLGKGQPDSLSTGSFFRQLADGSNGMRLHVGNLESERDFLDIEDACRAIGRLLDQSVPNGLYNICSGTPVAMSTVVDLMIEASGVAATIETEKNRLRNGDVPCMFGDYSHLEEATGWAPSIPIDESIRRLFA